MASFKKEHGYKKNTYEAKLNAAGIARSAWGNYGKNVNPQEYSKILGSYQQAQQAQPAQPAAAPSLSNQLSALQGKYTDTLTPTAGETEASTQLQNLITSKELGIAKAEAEPMAQKFVTGQSTALEKSAALKSMPLQTKLANLQAQRTAAADVLKTQLGFTEAALGREREDTRYQQGIEREDMLREESQKDALQQAAMSMGISTKTKKGGTMSTSNLKKAIAKAYKKAGLAQSESEALDLALKQKSLDKPYWQPKGADENKFQKTADQLKALNYSDEEIKNYILGGKSGDDDTKAKDKEFEKYTKELAQQVRELAFDREEAVRRLKIYFPDYNENVIYELIPD